MFSLLPLMGLASAAWSHPQLMAEQPLSIMPVQVNALQKSQASDIITNPEGTDALYTMNCDIVTQWGNFTYPSLRSEICFDADGETIYFHNLFPRYQECWVKGTIVGGNDIVIASGQPILVDPEYGEVYFYASQQSAEEEGLYYTVDGVRNASAKACWGETPVGLIPLEGDTQISSIEFYDLAGHRLPAATGTCICRTLLSNGKVVSKIVRN